jgi:hypothetical protein
VTVLQIGQHFLERHFSKGGGERRLGAVVVAEPQGA